MEDGCVLVSGIVVRVRRKGNRNHARCFLPTTTNGGVTTLEFGALKIRSETYEDKYEMNRESDDSSSSSSFDDARWPDECDRPFDFR